MGKEQKPDAKMSQIVAKKKKKKGLQVRKVVRKVFFKNKNHIQKSDALLCIVNILLNTEPL